MIRLVALLALLAAVPSTAEANSCNLYTPQRFGQIRIGCPITVYALPEVQPLLPAITRGGQALVPTIVEDQLTLQVTFEHYASTDSCTLYQTHEDRTFNRYVLTWDDLQAGDEITVDGYTQLVVPGPGTCETAEPWFYCQDGIQFCDDAMPEPDDDGNGVPDEEEDDAVGCSASSNAPSWLVLLPLLAFARRRRS